MRFSRVSLLGLTHLLPDEAWTSAVIEERLAAVYDRLGLNLGRLEWMSGVAERRVWPPNTRPSTVATRAGADLLAETDFPRERVGMLVYGGVCRDFLEPATASVVHRDLELPPNCEAFDLSNACLGFLDAMSLVAARIEAGQIDAGLVVTGESARPLLEQTMRHLTAPGSDRQAMKRAYASLTTGSAAAAALLVDSSLATSFGAHHPRLISATHRSATTHVDLCSGDLADGSAGPLMETDAEGLLLAGTDLAAETWHAFLQEAAWQADQVDRILTHQVGSAHRRLLLETLEFPDDRDYPTFPTLGNTGSAALPTALALAQEGDFLRAGDRVALLGIGSGIHCRMAALEW
ncbi:MAG: 3-oxoacyl-ACP synthase III [Planctomycetota bacterium]|jgi:3-oxoacyl-[acyl-carrier-protein] synthase-3|nr:3-oxoacyl-ACP synthase III [Planctomycetota bacterium]MDP6369000.1 3-oxoacyl-ACP synthase III [Planctomycetota bacterium]MDP6519098.1 3-oxoacyl-ACP synthase III [Planctomycetota bacterium]MDP6839661.1 3-oxoacyl-ACP synthase III [Planctomycetota bacterium]MDP6955851.1 3-oxoacyl-ACP synthase III [Planctomycetota bacterium]